MRCSVASTTASQAARPSARSSSICTMRMTELRIRMPISASTPRIATKPSGAPLGSSAATTPISAERRHRDHQEQPVEALQLDHQDRRHDEQHQRDDGGDRPLRLGAVLDRAGDRDVVAGGSASRELAHARLELR